MTPTRFGIRLAGVSDAALIARQRTRMFQEMGLVPESLFEAYPQTVVSLDYIKHPRDASERRIHRLAGAAWRMAR